MVCHTGEERMASCDVLVLFTTPIHSGINNSNSTFDGSYGRCGQSNQLHSLKKKKSQALPAFGQKNASATSRTLFYTKVRWLLRGKCLSRLYKLRNEVEIFLRENKNNLHVHFQNEELVVMLAYLADLFDHLNDMNLTLQGRDGTVSDVKNKLVGLNCSNGSLASRI